MTPDKIKAAIDKVKLFDNEKPVNIEGDNINVSCLHHIVGMIKDGSLETVLTHALEELEEKIECPYCGVVSQSLRTEKLKERLG